jgi:putative zinc finger/helix-turn-helix YgiT family protein
MKTTHENHSYKESGLGCVTLVGIPVNRCEACGEVELVIPQIGKLHALIARTLMFKPTRFVPEEIRFLRKHLGFSQSDLAGVCGVAAETVSRWETGKVEMNLPVERLLRVLVGIREPVQSYAMTDLTNMGIRKAERLKLKVQRDHEEWSEMRAA